MALFSISIAAAATAVAAAAAVVGTILAGFTFPEESLFTFVDVGVGGVGALVGGVGGGLVGKGTAGIPNG